MCMLYVYTNKITIDADRPSYTALRTFAAVIDVGVFQPNTATGKMNELF